MLAMSKAQSLCPTVNADHPVSPPLPRSVNMGIEAWPRNIRRRRLLDDFELPAARAVTVAVLRAQA